MIPLHRNLLRLATCAGLLCVFSVSTGRAQSQKQVADSLKKVVAEHRSDLHAADSIDDARGAIDLRFRLSEMVKSKEAIQLLQDAVAIADSADLLEEEIAALVRLAEEYARSGNHRQAYVEAMRLAALNTEWLAMQAEKSGADRDVAMARAEAERDSVDQVWQQRFAQMEEHQRISGTSAKRWKWIIVAIGILCLITIAGLMVRSAKVQRRIQKELADVRAEISALRQRPVNTLRTPPSPPPAPLATSPPAVDLVPSGTVVPRAEPLDPIVVAMFRKMGPERLAAIRAARERDDHEKVVRVVHSLKPQLVNFDRERFAALCARITAPGLHAERTQWTSDLDALEKGIIDALKQLDH